MGYEPQADFGTPASRSAARVKLTIDGRPVEVPAGTSVMRAAADNLVPVTLELGGKSPTIIGRSADKKKAGERIALGKMMNAGQICLAPDYLMVPSDQESDMIEAVNPTRKVPAMSTDAPGPIIRRTSRSSLRRPDQCPR